MLSASNVLRLLPLTLGVLGPLDPSPDFLVPDLGSGTSLGDFEPLYKTYGEGPLKNFIYSTVKKTTNTVRIISA